ncbi:hypothetical protein CASFOL_024072 [Castilleja foliolosa]|uniref:NAC domain-containing protein n=1 Tax=Castilleja foliolosa TaxID=1961234 RepID=A0ABD3CM92_9LAMI
MDFDNPIAAGLIYPFKKDVQNLNYINGGGPVKLSDININYADSSSAQHNNHVNDDDGYSMNIHVPADGAHAMPDHNYQEDDDINPDGLITIEDGFSINVLDDDDCSGAHDVHVMPADNYQEEDIDLDGLITMELRDISEQDFNVNATGSFNNDRVNLDNHNLQDQTTSNRIDQHFGGNTISLEDYHNWLNNGVLPADHDMNLDDDWINILNSIDNIGMVDVADQHLKTLLPMATSDCSFNNGTADGLINSGANEGELKKDGNSNSNNVDDHNVKETTTSNQEDVVEEEGFNIDDYLNNNDAAIQQETASNSAITINNDAVQETTSSIDNGDQSLKTLMPMGYRFMPNDNELIYYLSKKVNNQPLPCDIIPTVDLYELHPQDLLTNTTPGRNEKELYVFTHLKARNKGVTHAKRTTPNGFWKATSGDNDIKNRRGEVIGIRKVLVYYHGKGSKTNWIMHEYRLNDNSKVGDNYVLCKIHNHTHKKKAIH